MTPLRIFQRLAATFSILLLPAALQAADRVTILYDAFSDSKEMVKDWGFSALVEHDGKRILFDTGNNAEIFQRNVKRSEEHTSELQSRLHLVCRLLLEKKNTNASV